MCTNYTNIEELLVMDKTKPTHIFPDIGLTNCAIPIYTAFNFDMASIYFRILNSTPLEYYVFAGSAIGMARNGKNIPWADDYDIIMFEDQLDTYKNEVIPLLQQHGMYTVERYGNKDLLTTVAKQFDFTISYFEIFTSYVNDKGHVKCLNGGWGRYNTKGLTLETIKPARFMEFDNMGFEIPFFNLWREDVANQYGDVYDTVDVHIRHAPGNIIHSHFSKVYSDFDHLVQSSTENTMDHLGVHGRAAHQGLAKWVVEEEDRQWKDRMVVLQHIHKNKIAQIFILNPDFLKFTYCIKHYFPDVHIVLYLHEKHVEKVRPIILNRVDVVRVSNPDTLHKYEGDTIFYVHKPAFEVAQGGPPE